MNIFTDNTTNQWLTALAIIVGIMIGFRMIMYLLKRRIVELARRTETDIDDLVINIIQQTRFFFVFFVGVFFGVRALTVHISVFEWVQTLLLISLFIQMGFWANGLLVYFVERETKEEFAKGDAAEATTIQALGVLGKILIWAIAILMAMDNIPGVEINSLIASLGITGIAVALAVQNILEDLFASLSIVLDKPFVIGDYVVIGDLQGEVEKIGLKTTRVRSLSGEQLVFGNSDLLNSRIRNYKRMERRRAVYSFGVAQKTPTDQLKRIPEMIKEILAEHENITFDRSHFSAITPTSLDFETVFYVEDPSYLLLMDTQQAVNLKLLARFEQEGIEFARPSQTFVVDHEK